MEFRLTYEGPLYADNPAREGLSRAQHKHTIRKRFHGQLKVLWDHHPVLVSFKDARHYVDSGKSRFEVFASEFAENGYRFLPLVTRRLSLMCKLNILMLRHGEPGGVISAGDLDNRIKTLFDALRKPRSKSELGGETPSDGENPFYCLLEDDSLITHTVVETDTLLESVEGLTSDVRLVIGVNIRPYGGSVESQAFL